MKNFCIKSVVFLSFVLINSGILCAQSLEDLLKSESAKKMLNTVKEKTGVKSIEGTWQYEGAACQFKVMICSKSRRDSYGRRNENKIRSGLC
ncbi:MAG: lipocalin-like domain-containing protein [Odoribacter splanchnicus]